MAWSKWRGALVLLLLASVGLAWSQSPRTNRSASSSSERILTVHENGKALRCRVVQSWRTNTGAQAHQLQVLDTGEMITIVEDGSPTTVPTSVPGGLARALPMRIFHWGQRSRVSPAGAPLPPETIEPVAAVSSPVVQTTSAQSVTPVRTTPVSAQASSNAGNANCNDRVVAWEAATGKPVLLRSGSATIAQNAQSGPVVIQGAEPTIISAPDNARPRILQPRSNGPVIISEKVISSTPVSAGNSPTIISSTVVEPKTPPTLREKLSSTFHKPAVTKPAEPKPIEVRNDKVPLENPATKTTTATGKKADTKPATLPAAKADRTPFSTATAQSQPTPKTSPLAIPSGSATAKKNSVSVVKNETKDLKVPDAADASKKDGFDWRKMWGKQPESKIEQPGQATIDREKLRKDLPLASQTERKKTDILMAPERFDPAGEKGMPKVPAELVHQFQQQLPAGSVPTPLGVQSVLSARNGAQGPVQYIPVPVATVPEPIRPPTPPAPNVPTPPNPTGFVNAFSPPPNPQGQPQLTPEQMQVVIQHQAFMQQQAYLQQQAMQQRMQQSQTAQLVPVGYGAPTQVSYPANYGGPQAPNPVGQQQPVFPIQQVGYAPQANVGVNTGMDRRVIPAAAQQPAVSDSNTLANLIKVLQESQYPAQREWAATNLSTFDWRVYPHLPQVLVQIARQDAVASVRASAVYSLSRMNVQSEPVLSTLHALRSDADPRVRQEVDQAYIRMGLTPTQP